MEEPARPVASRIRDAVRTWIVFAAGGFVIAVLACMACGGVHLVWSTFWDRPLTGAILGTLAMGVPLIAVFLFFYGCGFAAACLSAALVFAASVAAISVWRSGRVPAACLAALLLLCPVLVFAQASALGAGFDPTAETGADALTAMRILALFSPLLVPALAGAWMIAGRRPNSRGGRAGDRGAMP